MKTHVLMHPRAEELLVERALRPLTDAEAQELAALGVADDESLDLAAAALMIATTRMEAMPDDLMARLAEPTKVDFRTTLAGVAPPVMPVMPVPTKPAAPPLADVIPIASAPRRRRFPVAWVAAAASMAIAVGAGLYARDATKAERSPAPGEARSQLLASAGDVRTLAWTATADAAAKGASGDVVWSAAQQRGYMRFVGLAANDRTAWQYQLWIFDRARDQAYPIDGGVFDVTSSGEVIVPITAKLHVDDATLFAVTVERPGGVVVSKRERIVVTAKPS